MHENLAASEMPFIMLYEKCVYRLLSLYLTFNGSYWKHTNSHTVKKQLQHPPAGLFPFSGLTMMICASLLTDGATGAQSFRLTVKQEI